MPLFESLNDDQIALLGCVVALVLSGGGMMLSYTLRQWIRGTMSETAASRKNAPAASDERVSQPASDRRHAA